MPAKIDAKGGSITERQVAWHLVHRRKVSNSRGNIVIENSTSSNYIELTCGEDIELGKSAAMGIDGKAYISSIVRADNKVCRFVSAESKLSGDKIKLINNDILFIPNGSYDVGSIVYQDGEGNLTTTATERTAGQIIQTIGIVQAENVIFVSVCKAITVE